MTLLLALFACDGADSNVDTDPIPALDLRLTEDDFDLPDGAEAWWGPEVEIGPGEERLYCLFGTYTGPDVGVRTLTTWQNRYGHHLTVNGTTASELDFPDGTLIDCTETGSLDMTTVEPLVLPTAGYVDGEELAEPMQIPEGIAVKLDEGQRWVYQAHYLNTGTETIRVKDVSVLEFLPPEEVETWAAPLLMSHSLFSVPPGEEESVTFDCAFGAEWNVIYTLGHMHEWGRAIKLEQLVGDATTTVFDVTEWRPEYRDAPPTDRYAVGDYVIPAAATLRTTCSWFNDTDVALEFPHEMCASVAMVYPQQTAAICDYQPEAR